MSIDDFRRAGGQVLPNDDGIDATVAEGLRLVAAFRKIKRQSDRRAVIDLAEKLGS